MKQRQMDQPVCVLVCMGGKCEKCGGAKFKKKLARKLEEEGLQDQVFVCGTECIGTCGKGPHAVVYPGGQHFREVAPKNVEDVLAAAKTAMNSVAAIEG